MKTFALIVYLFFANGERHTFVEDSGLTAAECSALLVLLTHQELSRPPFVKGVRYPEAAIVACEPEEEV
jgi:hypothetical protein